MFYNMRFVYAYKSSLRCHKSGDSLVILIKGEMMTFKQWFMVALAGSMILAGCSTPPPSAETLPKGDATRGAALFAEAINGAPSCVTCHSLDGSALVGPSMQGYAAVAGTRTDLSAEAYTHQSIVQPPAHTVSGFANVMYAQYGQKLSQQQLADIIAYLLTLS
jgi:mono/diheme cytochrome c family protein